MRALQPVTPATRETAQWWLDGVRAELPLGTAARGVEPVVRRHAARVSPVVLAVACSLAGIPATDRARDYGDTLLGRLIATEQRRVAQ